MSNSNSTTKPASDSKAHQRSKSPSTSESSVQTRVAPKWSLLFWFIMPLISAARRHSKKVDAESYKSTSDDSIPRLQMDDLFELPEEFSAENAGERLTQAWKDEVKRRPDSPSVMRALLVGVPGGWTWITTVVLIYLLRIVFYLAQVVFFYFVLEYFVTTDYTQLHAILFVMGIVVSYWLYIFLDQQQSWLTGNMQLQVETALKYVLLQKAMLLSESVRSPSGTVGLSQYSSIITGDVTSLGIFIGLRMLPLFCGMVESFAVIGLTFFAVSYSTFAAIALLMFCVWLSNKLSNITADRSQLRVDTQGKRIKLLTEVLNGIKSVKFFAWEGKFLEKLGNLRQIEIRNAKNVRIYEIHSMVLALVTPVALGIVVFLIYAAYEELGLSQAFLTILLVGMLRTTLFMLPIQIASYNAMLVSARSVREFLTLPELTPRNFKNDAVPVGTIEVNAKNAAFHWTEEEEVDGAENADRGRAANGVLPSASSPAPGAGNASVEQLAVDSKKKSNGAANGVKESNGVANGAKSGKEAENSSNSSSGDANQSSDVALQNFELLVETGSLTAVIGRVGSGKTALALSILGEIHQTDPDCVSINGTVAYVPQAAFIINNTVQENILMGLPLDEKKYQKVLEICALLPDMEVLEDGDQTEIGGRGVNLSGGQKQRVSLARAAYSDAPILILDDPLSAVDSHVGKHIFEQCLTGYLKDRTRLFITNQTQFLSACDQVVLIEDGTIALSGTPDEVAKQIDLAAIVEADEDVDGTATASEAGSRLSRRTSEVQTEEKDGSANEPNMTIQVDKVVPLEDDNLPKKKTNETYHEFSRNDEVELSRKVSEMSMSITIDHAMGTMSDSLAMANYLSNASVKDGSKKKGKRSKDVVDVRAEKPGDEDLPFWAQQYKLVRTCVFMIGGSFNLMNIIVQTILFVAVFLLQNMWAGFYTLDSFTWMTYEVFAASYIATGVATAISVYLRAMLSGNYIADSLIGLHQELLERIFRAPVSFFDTTPNGRILAWFNAFSVLDVTLPFLIEVALGSTFGALLFIVFIASLNPVLFAVVGPIFIFLVYLIKHARPSDLQLKKLKSEADGPVGDLFAETLGGMPSVRAYGAQDIFRRKNMNFCDKFSVTAFASNAMQQWLFITANLSVSLGIVFTGIVVVLDASPDRSSGEFSFESAFSAVVLYLVVTLAHVIAIIVRIQVDFGTAMETVHQLRMKTLLQNEADAVIEDSRPPKSWPSNGVIKFKNYYMRYRDDLPSVLKDIDISIRENEKIGIVGRTGAGKSSLTTALFRIVEAQSGHIEIDGLDTSLMGLDDLRSNLSIINQDPVMFEGTIRYNLDPFETLTDDELWAALKIAQLDGMVLSNDEGLGANVEENGSNFSGGQKQQFSLARALLRKPKVLILDEATSSIDNETDALIQSAIREHCGDTTVLTIAHRLHTIMDSDRILVMDKGHVAEFASPLELLAQPDSIFLSMVDATGAETAAKLKEMAK